MIRGVILSTVLFLLFAAVPSLYSQIASVHYAEAFPELCLWVNHIPFVKAPNAESVRVSEWEENRRNGTSEAGYTELIYESNFLVRKTSHTKSGVREDRMTYMYDQGYLFKIVYDFPLYDLITDYY